MVADLTDTQQPIMHHGGSTPPDAPAASHVVSAPDRTGPLGRLARVLLAAVFGVSLWSVVDERLSARFRNPHVLTEPSAWTLDALMLLTFILLVGALASAVVGPRLVRRVQLSAVVVLAGCFSLAGVVGLVVYGSVWGFPLADLVWWFDVLMLAEGLIACMLAVVLGTPGCEIGVWPELLARLPRGRPAPANGLACVVGLNFLDRWETQHKLRRLRE